jgi:hypothetical protein
MDTQYYDDWQAMQASIHHDGPPTNLVGTMIVEGRKISCPPYAVGCCLLKLYRRMRDDKTPVKNGERLVCHRKCKNRGMGQQWTFNNDTWKLDAA